MYTDHLQGNCILHCLNDEYEKAGNIAGEYERDTLINKNVGERMNRIQAQEAWYYYATAPYSGRGHILVRSNKGYFLFDLGHYSCDGPIDSIFEPMVWESPEVLIMRMTAELKNQVGILLEAAKIKETWKNQT